MLRESQTDVPTIEYLLAMPEPHSHLLEVEVRFSCAGDGAELVMPSWTPGSYLLREFPRHVQDFRASGADGAARAWTKLDKGTWRVEARAGEPLRVAYRVYANELTVRTSHLDGTHAFVSPASVFMFIRGRERERLALQIDAPEPWRVATSLPSAGPFRFEAADYDELVDSPLEIGEHRRVEWEQEGIRHVFAVWGRGGYEAETLVHDTSRIIHVVSEMFGGLPYERYLFILHLFPGGRGGLEHKASCALQAERWAFDGEPYEQLLALIAHEFFHVWNAKRIRPAALGPFDYTAENYTRDLWVVEGLTTYYTDLIVCRAGLLGEEKYLARLAEMIERLQKSPGRHHQTLAESSFDSWIRFYRPDENSGNSQISYYHKGALVGLLLDMEIRRATGNARSLDEVMRLLWERYGKVDAGYPEGGVEAVAEEVAGEPLGWFFEKYVRGTEELDFDRALATVGLRLERSDAAPTDGPGRREGTGTKEREDGGLPRGRERGDSPRSREGREEGGAANVGRGAEAGASVEGRVAAVGGMTKGTGVEGAQAGAAPGRRIGSVDGGGISEVRRVEARLGVRARDQGGKVQVVSVREGGPGRRAGLDAGDEVVALDGLRVGSVAEVAARLGGMEEGGRVEVALFRRDELMRVGVEVGAEAGGNWRVVVREGAVAGGAAVAAGGGAAEGGAAEVRRGWLGAVGPAHFSDYKRRPGR